MSVDSTGLPPDDAFNDFLESMPASYRAACSTREARVHHQAVAGRGVKPVHVAQCSVAGGAGPDSLATFSSADALCCLCVVADDTLGLMSLISCAVLAHSLDVVRARVFCRPSVARDEAVDFVWVRASKATASNPVRVELVSIESVILSLLNGEVDLDGVSKKAAPTERPPPAEPELKPKVYFDAARAVLVVESGDRRGLLLAITLAVAKQSGTIVGSTVTTIDGVASDEFEVVDQDGRVLSEERRIELVDSVRRCLI